MNFSGSKMPDILRVALTGGIACGKSISAEILENLGCYIHHSDQAAHKLMQPRSPAWEKIVNHFGKKILNTDQTINRKYLGEILFRDDKERTYVNRIIHPLVLQEKKKKVAQLEKKSRYKIFVSEAALTIESGFSGYFHKIVAAYCPPSIQLERLMKRDGISSNEAKKKIAAQMPVDEKKQYADYVIDTSGSIESTIEQTEKVFRYLMMDYQQLNSVKSKKWNNSG